MKLIYTVCCIAFFSFGMKAQQSEMPTVPTEQITETHFFGQCKLNFATQQEFVDLENRLNAIPSISMVRVDPMSKQLLLLTKNIESLSIPDFLNWISLPEGTFSCVNIGLLGVNTVLNYSNSECNEK